MIQESVDVYRDVYRNNVVCGASCSSLVILIQRQLQLVGKFFEVQRDTTTKQSQYFQGATRAVANTSITVRSGGNANDG